jgi:hypothetical protein
MWAKIIATLTGQTVGEVLKYKAEKRRLKNEVELEKLRGKREWEAGKTKRAEASEGRDHEWELLSIRNSGYKDEYVLGLISIPMILSFIPAGQPYVVEGFKALEGTTDWYRFLVLSIFLAVYGVRLWRRKPVLQA